MDDRRRSARLQGRDPQDHALASPSPDGTFTYDSFDFAPCRSVAVISSKTAPYSIPESLMGGGNPVLSSSASAPTFGYNKPDPDPDPCRVAPLLNLSTLHPEVFPNSPAIALPSQHTVHNTDGDAIVRSHSMTIVPAPTGIPNTHHVDSSYIDLTTPPPPVEYSPSDQVGDNSSISDSINSDFEADLEATVARKFLPNADSPLTNKVTNIPSATPSDKPASTLQHPPVYASTEQIDAISSKLDIIVTSLSDSNSRHETLTARLNMTEEKVEHVLKIQSQILAVALESKAATNASIRSLPNHSSTLHSHSDILAKLYASVSRIESHYQNITSHPTRHPSSGISFASSASDHPSQPPIPSLQFSANMATVPSHAESQKHHTQPVPSHAYSSSKVDTSHHLPSATPNVDPAMASILQSLVESKSSKAPSNTAFPVFSGDSKFFG